MTLDGPFDVLDANGNPLPGVHYNTTSDDYALHAAALAAYRVAPEPFQRVWAGDDPQTPVWTVALRFPDQATADAVCASLNPPA